MRLDVGEGDTVVGVGAGPGVGEGAPAGVDAEAVEDLGRLARHEGLQQDAGDAQRLGRREDGAVDRRGVARLGALPGRRVRDEPICLLSVVVVVVRELVDRSGIGERATKKGGWVRVGSYLGWIECMKGGGLTRGDW